MVICDFGIVYISGGIFKQGIHGVSLADEYTYIYEYLETSVRLVFCHLLMNDLQRYSII